MRMQLWLPVVLLALAVPAARAGDDYAELRRQLVREIAEEALLVGPWTGRAVLDARVMAAIGKVPRHEFVPAEMRPYAYLNRPIPVAHGETVSQPYIVALMIDLAGIDKGDTVLEIGTGAGYRASVLAELGADIYTMEIVPELEADARALIDRLGYGNVHTRVGDYFYGWAERGPFDAIIVTVAPREIPPPLLGQLKPGGRMVIPVGDPEGGQSLLVVEKDADGVVTSWPVLPVVFAPMTGGERI